MIPVYSGTQPGTARCKPAELSRTVTLDVQYLGLGNGLEGETPAARRASTELHREDFTLTWQTMPARGIAVVGPSIKLEMDIQIVPRG